MSKFISDVAFTPAVKQAQETNGSRPAYARMQQRQDWPATITDDLAAFISERDSFYIGTASAGGQPYIQHRGGKPGFLKVLDEKTLAFADFRGNRQYITMGNLSENDQAHLFLMDYPNRQRVKIWGRARVVTGDDELLARLTDTDYVGRPEQAVVLKVAAWDVNCPQHIRPRFTDEEVAEITAPLKKRIAELESLTRMDR